MIKINPMSNEPIYEQIIRQYKYLVMREYLKPGCRSVCEKACPEFIRDAGYGSESLSGVGADRNY